MRDTNVLVSCNGMRVFVCVLYRMKWDKSLSVWLAREPILWLCDKVKAIEWMREGTSERSNEKEKNALERASIFRGIRMSWTTTTNVYICRTMNDSKCSLCFFTHYKFHFSFLFHGCVDNCVFSLMYAPKKKSCFRKRKKILFSKWTNIDFYSNSVSVN